MHTSFKIAVGFSIGFLLSAVIFFTVFNHRLEKARGEYEGCTADWDSTFMAISNSISRLDSVSFARDTMQTTFMRNDQFLWTKIQAIADSTNVNIQ